MTEPTREQQLARLYRMLFMYETDPAAEWLPAYLTTMGQEDCRWPIRRLEAEIDSGPSTNSSSMGL